MGYTLLITIFLNNVEYWSGVPLPSPGLYMVVYKSQGYCPSLPHPPLPAHIHMFILCVYICIPAL